MHDPQQTPAPDAHRAATWRRYLRFWGPRAEADVDDELAFHVEMRARDYMAGGLSEPEARQAATRRLGNLASARTECIAITARRERRMTRAQLIDAFVHDVRFAWRTLGRQKGWTLVAGVTLALGIGANTAVFSVVNALLLHPLPYPNSSRVAIIYQEPTEGNSTHMRVFVNPQPEVIALWRANARSFEALEPYAASDQGLRASDGTNSTVRTGFVLPSFAAFTGVRPTIGRAFGQADVAAREPVVMLSEPFWRSRYGADPTIVGKPIILDRKPYTIVGVMPAAFRLPRLSETVSDVWAPLDLKAKGLRLSVIGRLRPNVTTIAATRELNDIYTESPEAKREQGQFRTRLSSPSELVGFRQSLVLLSWAVALVLLIACGNVAHLLLARTAARQRELAIRAALGASRLRIVRQLLTESVLLGAAGCAGGLLLGWLGLHALVAIRPDSLPELAEARMDGTTLFVTIALSAITGIVVGSLGALNALRHSAHDALKAGALAVSQSRAQRRLRSLLVVSEMAVSTVLLVGATLLVRSIIHLQSIDPGFNPRGLYSIHVSLPRSQYSNAAARSGFTMQLTDRIRNVPGVASVTVAAGAPPWRSFMIGMLQIEGEPAPTPGATNFVDTDEVGPDFFRTMGIPLLQGSTLTDTSRQAVVNDGFAKKHFPGTSALGKRFRVVYDGKEEWNTIVGVVGNASTGGLTSEATTPIFYVPAVDLFEPVLLVRTNPGVDPIASVRALIAQADPTLAPPTVSNIELALARTVAGPRFTMLLLVVFTGLALVLAAVGLYGVMAYAVAQQTREIGIRIALGATRGSIAKSVLGRGVAMAVAGAVLGTIGARWGSKLLESFLYGIERTDVVSFAIGVVLLVGTAVVACLVPMRRAIGVDPLVSIRAD
ncbi:MAG TPA: ABC transporter permease [Gemmatimonadaceae bacterium]|nr:ABC transporter permease [Gemmatimonadaceae bacterium]